MFIGSEYQLCDQEGRSMLGYKRIVIRDRVLSRTEERVLFTKPDDPPGGGTKTVTSYFHTLMCLVDGGDSAEIDEEEFHCEVIGGLYEFCGSK